jgi:hypothetical protein
MGKQKVSNEKVNRVEEWPEPLENQDFTVNDPGEILEQKLKDKKKYAADEGKDEMVNLIFKHNRTFELTIGKKNFVFGPKECKKFPAKYLKHPDFLQQKDYFIVKEVK